MIEDVMKGARIATPCTANWDEMVGDDKVRHCAQCQLNVLNAAAMTDEEVLEAMVRVTQGQRVCMRMYRRADGTFLTKDCPVGLRKLQQQARRVAGLISSGLALFLTLPGFAQQAGSEKKCDGKNKPRWHSTIKTSAPATVNGGKTATSPSLPVNNTPRMEMGDVAFTPTQYEAMAVSYKAKVKAAQNKYGANSVEAANEMIELSSIYQSQGKHAEFDELLRQAVTILEAHKDYTRAHTLAAQTESIAPKSDAKCKEYWQQRVAALAKRLPSPAAKP